MMSDFFKGWRTETPAPDLASPSQRTANIIGIGIGLGLGIGL